jgi:hypothetical protein
MLADPLCRYDFCLESDGALPSSSPAPERARDLRQKPFISLRARTVASREMGAGVLLVEHAR